jgi:hypothetical protein
MKMERAFHIPFPVALPPAGMRPRLWRSIYCETPGSKGRRPDLYQPRSGFHIQPRILTDHENGAGVQPLCFPYPISWGVSPAGMKPRLWRSMYCETPGSKGRRPDLYQPRSGFHIQPWILTDQLNGAGVQPLCFPYPISWGVAPGWYEAAPMALQLLQNAGFKGPKARSIPA